ncbi:hypothetical protein [Maribacter sp. 2-571]|uniref:hypothetical protein n=1 Tax=Maribacter sp. 2-571 TaxID=3417569 RepID=UPI003D3512C3
MGKYVVFSFILFIGLFSNCSDDSSMAENDEEVVVPPENEGLDETPEEDGMMDDMPTPLTTNLKTYIFGHSLIVHDPPLIPTPSNETTVPHWLHVLSEAGNMDFSVSGQYGFLPQHANLPPIAQWGFDVVTPAWDSDTETFAQANFNTVLLTAGNFVQYRPSDLPYEGDNPNNFSPESATLQIFDWVSEQEPGVPFYIYENWPDMAPFMEQFPPTDTEFENYNTYLRSDFHDWWLQYYQNLKNARPDLTIQMIPVGPIIGKLLTETSLNTIPVNMLYEDDAPHGRPTIYFLAGLINYMAMYGIPTEADFQVPETVHSEVRESYATLVPFIWNELQQMEDADGANLVFPETP